MTMNARERASLDRHITGNGGEDQFRLAGWVEDPDADWTPEETAAYEAHFLPEIETECPNRCGRPLDDHVLVSVTDRSGDDYEAFACPDEEEP